MKILVTGATGFIGWHCADQLIRQGNDVSALLRAVSDPSKLPYGIKQVSADYTDQGSLKQAVTGFNAVVHWAGIVRALNLPAYWKANVESTQSLSLACHAVGVKRLVIISSLSAGGKSCVGIPREESMPDEPLTFYGLSKIGAEIAARRFMQSCTILRPCSVYGPREKDIFNVFKLVATKGIDIRPKGKTPLLSFVNGIDVARAVCTSLSSDVTIGKCYYLSDGVIQSWNEFLSHIEKAVGRKARKIAIPIWSAELYALLGEFFAMITGRIPLITREKVYEMRMDAWTCSPARFVSDTGFEFSRPIEQGVSETAEWYFEQGWIKR